MIINHLGNFAPYGLIKTIIPLIYINKMAIFTFLFFLAFTLKTTSISTPTYNFLYYKLKICV